LPKDIFVKKNLIEYAGKWKIAFRKLLKTSKKKVSIINSLTFYDKNMKQIK